MAVETGILLESGTNELELLEFVVGNQHYGINVAKINELCPYQEPTICLLYTSTEIDRQIAKHLIPHIVDGATLQLGIGSMPNALGEIIAKSDLKDLGMHTAVSYTHLAGRL